MNLKELKELKNSDILLIFNSSSVKSKNIKLKANKILIWFIIYTVLISFAGFIIFTISPLNELLFPGSSPLTQEDMQKVELLNQRMLFLSHELEDLKSTNERLKYALILGDSSLADSLKNIKFDSDSKKENKSREKKNKLGGNIFAVFKNFFFNDGGATQQKITYFENPVSGFISRNFNSEKGHMGIDFVVKTGTPIYAAANGYIIFSDYTNKDGYMLIIEHPDNFITVYKHCSVLIKKERDTVLQGELIALSGNTGEITTGPHLHFEIWKDGQPINPKSVLINY